MRTHKIIGIFAIIASLGLIAFQATKNESTVTFFTPEEVYANPVDFEKKIFRVSGLVLEGSKNWNSKTNILTFKIGDLKGHEFIVTYKGVPPDLFKERQGVIVEGRLNESSTTPVISGQGAASQSTASNPLKIHANLLMVKHSEVYDTQGDHSEMREMRLRESLFNDVQK